MGAGEVEVLPPAAELDPDVIIDLATLTGANAVALGPAAPSWAETSELELARGATGWGARTLLRYLEGLVSA